MTTTTTTTAKRIGLTSGCPAGVGLELLVTAIAVADDGVLPPSTSLTFFGSAALLLEGARRARIDVVRDDDVVVIGRRRVRCVVADVDDPGRFTVAGRVDDGAVVAQRHSLVLAIAAADRGEIDAMVTAPVRKSALVIDGVHWPGQTELVHHTLHDDDGPPLMVFSGASFLLGLHTVHIALRDVGPSIDDDDAAGIAAITRSITQLAAATRTLLGVQRPTIAVLGVNPHAGEGGMFGFEEQRVLTPAIAAINAAVGIDSPVDVVGPIPGDGFFADVARARKKDVPVRAHAVLAMHHDQGLAPYKLLVDGEGVNITWGVRVARTSPDHGTADAIAGQGIADPSSTIAAIAAAVVLARAGT